MLALSVPILSKVFSSRATTAAGAFSFASRLVDEADDPEPSLLLGRIVRGVRLASSNPRRTESCGWSQFLRGDPDGVSPPLL